MEAPAETQLVGQRGWLESARACLQSPWLVAFLLLIGILARARYYGVGLSFWYDEAFLLVPVYERSAAELLGPLPSRVIIPPLFLWLLKGTYLAAGPGELAMRLPAFTAGLLGLFLFVPAAIRLVGRPAGFWAAALACLSVHHLMHSSEVRCYTVDFLSTVLILWAGCAYLRAPSLRTARGAGAALFALALAAPWFSFSSVLVFAAVAMALLADNWQRGDRPRWLFALGLMTTLGLSVAALWFVQARHMYYPGLVDHFRGCWDGFPASWAPLTVAGWSLRSFIGLGHYASTDLGIPLLPLGVWGAVVLWRQSRPIALLLIGPCLITYAAALASKYPFSDRTIFFLAPCVWCLAMAGFWDCWQRLAHGWRALLAPALLAVMLAVSFIKLAKDGLQPLARAEFREALCYVHDHREPGDQALFWCSDINRVYFGHVFANVENDCLGEDAQSVAARLGNCRLWIVAPTIGVDAVTAPFRRLPMREAVHRSYWGLEVIRFDPVGLGEGSF